jgi:hypothetical protein
VWRKDWISFDSCLFVPDQNRLYIGLTSIEGDIFWYFDRATRAFVSCGYKKLNKPFDAKFHRSLLQRKKDGCLYGATRPPARHRQVLGSTRRGHRSLRSTVHEVRKHCCAIASYLYPGICLDPNLDVIYGIAAVPERMFSYDLNTGASRDLGPTSSGMEFVQAQNIELDDDGCAWSAWSITRAWQNSPGPDSKRLCKYDPKQGKIIYFQDRTAQTRI